MPIPVKRARRKALRLSLSVLVGVMPIVLGLLILYWQAERSLQETSEQAAGNAVRQFERMLDNAALAARKVMPVAGRPCPEAELTLREQVAIMPFVRSVNLTRDNTIYCTSLFGGFDEPVRIENYVDGRLLLMPGNQVTPDAALLVLRDSDGKRGVLAAIDGRYLSYVLDLVDRRSRQVLVVGPSGWMPRAALTATRRPPMRSPPYRSLRSVIRCGCCRASRGRGMAIDPLAEPGDVRPATVLRTAGRHSVLLAIQAGRLAQQRTAPGPGGQRVHSLLPAAESRPGRTLDRRRGAHALASSA